MCEGEREAEPGTDDNINIGLKLMKELLLPDCSSFCLDVETVVDWVFFLSQLSQNCLDLCFYV